MQSVIGTITCGFAMAFVTGVASAQARSPLRFERVPLSISFRDGDVGLSGALLRPEGPGPFPALVIVHGAGPATYDEPAFIVHANAFVSCGFAVLLYDKRGSGHSTGQLATSDYNDLANDVGAAVRFLRARRDILPGKIGVLGRSEGAWVGTLAARHDPSIAFVIMSSGAAVSPYHQTLFWTRRSLRLHGASDSTIARALATKSAVWSYYRMIADGRESARDVGRAIHDSLVARLAEFRRYDPEMTFTLLDPETSSVQEFRAIASMIYYDPAPVLEALRVPVLELLGAEDEVVEPATTVAALEQLRSTGHDVTIRVFPNVGHSLLVMKGDTIVGYASNYLEFATRWARKRVDHGAPAP